MTSTLKKLSFLILVSTAISSEILMAAPFDKTGIIDLKNEGTTRGSCAAVGSRLQLATNQIYVQIIQRPAQGQDGQWKNQQDAKEILDFGKSGSFWSKRLSENFTKHVPPSQMNDYQSQWGSASQRFDQAIQQDPWKGVYAWNYCGEAYGFLK
jgi:hypothetical protein